MGYILQDMLTYLPLRCEDPDLDSTNAPANLLLRVYPKTHLVIKLGSNESHLEKLYLMICALIED